MAENVLTGKVQITAPGAVETFTGVAKSVAILEKQLERLKRIAAGNLNFSQLERVTQLINKTQGSLNALNKINPLSPTFNSSANSATLALTNLGRVAQDLPFGFIGIANNLNPLLESFQRLKVETGSSGGALKALASSLGGAGGLGLALSLLTTGLTLVTTGFGAWTRGLGGAKQKAEEANQSLEALNRTLADQKSRLDAVSDSFSFLSSLNKINIQIGFNRGGDALALQGDIVMRAEEEIPAVKKALQDLQKLSDERLKEYQEGVIDEKNYNEQLEAISKQRAELWTKERDLSNQQITDRARLRFQQKKDRDEELKEQKEANEKALAEQKKYINEVISRGKELAAYFEGRRVVPNFSIFDSQKEMFDKAKKIIEDVASGGQQIIFRPNVEVDPIFSIEKGYVKPEQFQRFKNLAKESTELLTKKLGDFPSKLNLIFTPEAIANQKTLDSMKAAAEELNKALTGALKEGLQSGIESIGAGLGNILSGQDFGKQFAQVFGDLFTTIGKALIKFGIVKAGLDKILGPGGIAIPGALAIGLGLFAIAAGTLVKNISGGRAAGGGVMKNKSYLVGEDGPELFTPNTGGQITPNNQLGGRGAAMSGGMNFQVIGTNVIQGRDLVQIFKLQQQSDRRLI